MKLDICLQKLEGAYAPNTLRSYYADARSFVDWCKKRSIEPFPINSETLCTYIECLQVNSAYSSIRRRIASLRRLNRMLGFEDKTRTEDVYLAIRRLRRSKGLEQRQAVFCAINHGRCEDRAICDRNANDIIKRAVVKVKRCERPSDLDVSGHSLRVGAAQDLLIRGYDLAAIMRAGGWSDPSTVLRYLRFSQHNIWQ